MAASSSASMPGLGQGELENQQSPLLQHSSGEGASADVASLVTADAASPRSNRNRHPSKISQISVCVCTSVILCFWFYLCVFKERSKVNKSDVF